MCYLFIPTISLSVIMGYYLSLPYHCLSLCATIYHHHIIVCHYVLLIYPYHIPVCHYGLLFITTISLSVIMCYYLSPPYHCLSLCATYLSLPYPCLSLWATIY